MCVCVCVCVCVCLNEEMLTSQEYSKLQVGCLILGQCKRIISKQYLKCNLLLNPIYLFYFISNIFLSYSQFHSPVSPSLPLPCVTVCHHISTGLYHLQGAQNSRFTTNNKLLRGCTVCSSNVANISFKRGILCSLKMVYLCRNMEIPR